ncbi:hypothetical protein BU23DRAFT_632442 [Bimuria novae-zelandiae CBS 107.79]|uniref:Thiolase-like protein type 1 additional C-terminal domain-containing protein n=1 Tax=Bimuria novae-zelandiae CBS 107.79 TaxID=1447943 RepID=A0A6A5VL62_9PLEO|nr:hypothetical protein BU23DRAFT_632442 [Bimuria novae-zelandiae CBS 107.79]
MPLSEVPIVIGSSRDGISIVKTWTWPYPDHPGLLASKLGVEPKHKFYSEHGGDKPEKLFDEAAKRVARGECTVAVVAGGESLASSPSQSVESVFTPTSMDLGNTRRRQSVKVNNDESATLYAEFSKVASANEIAWSHGQYSDEKTIGTVSKKNCMICFPYPLLMNAFNTVNLAAACILTCPTHARALGHIPLLNAALSLAQISVSDIDLFDFYPCFPIVPKLAAHHLGLPVTGGEKSMMLLGGLTSFGGAGNSYSMHAFTTMTRAIREGKARTGMVLCNGGVLSYQYVVVLSKEGRRDGAYPRENPLPDEVTDLQVPEIEERPRDEAIIETYAVEYKRDGTPLRGYVVGRLKGNGKRFLANHGDESTLRQMAGAGEVVGKSGWVESDADREGRSLFTFEKRLKV